jgi:hypothetical protein
MSLKQFLLVYLWIDEIDKAFSNTESKGDSGTSNRVLATFISWLSEKKNQFSLLLPQIILIYYL